MCVVMSMCIGVRVCIGDGVHFAACACECKSDCSSAGLLTFQSMTLMTTKLHRVINCRVRVQMFQRTTVT